LLLLVAWRLSLVGFVIYLIIETRRNIHTGPFWCSFLFARRVRKLMAFRAHSRLILKPAVCLS
jgi:hypothetical protein